MAVAAKLTDEDLVTCLQNFCNFPINTDSLKTPTAHFLESAFDCFFRDLQPEALSLNGAMNKMHSVLDHLELYEDSMDLMLYYAKARHVMNIAGFPDLSITDLTIPKPKRTKKILTYLVSLWNHILKKYHKFKTINNRQQEENDNLQRLHSQMISSEQQHNDLAGKKVDLAHYEQLQKDSEALDTKITVAEKGMVALQETNKKLNKETTEGKNIIREMEVNIVLTREHIEELEASILKSPQRLSAEIQALKDKVSKEEEMQTNVRKKDKVLTNQIEVRQSQLEQAEKAVTALKKCQLDFDRVKSEIASVGNLAESISHKEKELKDAENESAASSTALKLLEEKIAHQDMQEKSKFQALQTVIDMKSESLDVCLNASRSRDAMLRRASDEKQTWQTNTSNLEAEIKSTNEAAVVEIEDVGEKCKEVMKMINDDTDETMSYLKKLL